MNTTHPPVCVPPYPTPQAGRAALAALIRNHSLLSALEALHAHMGDIFRLSLPNFRPVVLVGPEANRFVLVEARDRLLWRSDSDPVARLLRRGMLVQDGEAHDRLRSMMSPAFHRTMLDRYTGIIWECTAQACARWRSQATLDMLIEMRRITLQTLMQCLFDVNITPHLGRLWKPILHTLRYISPGPWLIWPGMPRPWYNSHIQRLDRYLYRLIASRRANSAHTRDDLLSIMVADQTMDDDLIRDQLLTMLIAGHDTSTALLSWALYLLGQHPAVLRRAQQEVHRELAGHGQDQAPTREQLSRLALLTQVINEALRLYPPIHTGNRRAGADLQFGQYYIPAGTRITFSIYLMHRHPMYWPRPHSFEPERFASSNRAHTAPYTFLPFGGGPRNCIGSGFAMLEARIVLAYILLHFELEPLSLPPGSVLKLKHAGAGHMGRPIHPHLGATLEPSPGVFMRVRRLDTGS